MKTKLKTMACLAALLLVAPMVGAHGHATTLTVHNPATGNDVVTTGCWIYTESGLEYENGAPDYEGTELEFYSANGDGSGDTELGGLPFWDVVEFMAALLSDVDPQVGDLFHDRAEWLAERVTVISPHNNPDAHTHWNRGNPDYSMDDPENVDGLVDWILTCSGA